MSIQEIRSAATARITELKQEIEALRTPGDLTAVRVAGALKEAGIFGEKVHMPPELRQLVGEYAAMTKNEKRDQLEKAESECHNLEVLYNNTSLPPVWWGVGQAACTCSTGLLIARGGAWGVTSSWSTPYWFLGGYFCGALALSGCFTASVGGPLMLTMDRNKVKERREAIEQYVLDEEWNCPKYCQDPGEDYANRNLASVAKNLLERRRESQARSSNIEEPQSQAPAQDELKLD